MSFYGCWIRDVAIFDFKAGWPVGVTYNKNDFKDLNL